MKRYSEELLKGLKQSASIQMDGNLKIISKYAPDAISPTAIDPRMLAGKSGLGLKLLPFIPKFLLKTDSRPENLPKVRESMNKSADIVVVENGINIENATISAADGYQIPIRIYHSEHCEANGPCLYHIHGGGLIAGNLEQYDEALKLFVENNRMVVVSVAYRLMPENPYPIPHKDCLTVLHWIYNNADKLKINKNAIFVCGDSGGGVLAQYCSSMSKENGMIRGQLLLYPSLNLFAVKDKYYNPSLSQFEYEKKHKRIAKKLIEIGPSTLASCKELMNVKEMDEHINPYIGDPAGNPPTFFAFGELDYIKLESIAWAHKLQDAEVETHIVVYKGLAHGFFNAAGIFPQSEDCIDEMGAFIRAHM